MAQGRPGRVAGGGAETWAEAWSRWSTRKQVGDYEREARKSGLTKVLTARDLTVLGVSAIIGAGIFVLPGVAVGVAGPAAVLGFVIAAAACAFAALNYAELSSMMPISGSAYAYTYVSLGELLAWLVGWNLLLEYAVGNITVATGWSGFAVRAMAGAGIPFPAELAAGPAAGGIFNVPAALIVLLITFILIRGVRESARTATLIVGVKLFVLLFVIFYGALYLDPANWDPFAPFGYLAVMGSAALVFFAFIGFDAVSTAAEETKDPGRNMPIGIIASLVLSTVLYIAVFLVLTGITPWPNFANAPDAAAAAFAARGLTAATLLISVGAIVGITGVLLVFQLGLPRILMTMARDGMLPPVFAKVHPTYHTPVEVTVVAALLVAFFAGVTPITLATQLTNVGTLFAFVVVSLAVIVLRKTRPDAARPFRVPGVPWVPLVGVGLLGALMLSLGELTILRFFAWSGLGLLVYGFYGAPHSKLRAQSREVLLAPRRGQ